MRMDIDKAAHRATRSIRFMRTGPVVPAHPGDDREQGSGAGGLADALCPALRAPEGAAFPSLTRWHSCLSHCRTPAGALARAQGVRRLRAVARVPVFFFGSPGDPGRNAKGFALSFPKPE